MPLRGGPGQIQKSNFSAFSNANQQKVAMKKHDSSDSDEGVIQKADIYPNKRQRMGGNNDGLSDDESEESEDDGEVDPDEELFNQ